MSEKEVVKKKWMSWTLSEDMSVLTCAFDDVLEHTPDLVCNLREFFKSVKWERLEDVEKLALVNGIKQKLADKTAASKDLAMSAKEKRAVMAATWERLCNKRLWNAPAQARGKIQSKDTKAINNALATADVKDLAVMVKLGLTTQERVDAELARRKAEVKAEAARKPKIVRVPRRR